MSQSTTSLENLFSPRASLAALATQLQSRGLFEALRTGAHIAQKTVKESPSDKLLDILLTLLAGGQSLVQINTLLRADPALQRSVGRPRGSRTIRGSANPRCGDDQACAADAAGAHDPLSRSQSSGSPHLPRRLVDLGCGFDRQARWQAR